MKTLVPTAELEALTAVAQHRLGVRVTIYQFMQIHVFIWHHDGRSLMVGMNVDDDIFYPVQCEQRYQPHLWEFVTEHPLHSGTDLYKALDALAPKPK